MSGRIHRNLPSESVMYSLLKQTTVDLYHVIDQNGNLVDYSVSFLNALGYTEAEAQYLNVKDWDPTTDRSTWDDDFYQSVLEPVYFEIPWRRKDGTYFEVEVNVRSVNLGEESLLYAIGRDLSAIRETQSRLKSVNEALTSTLERQKEIFSIIGHELRTPVAAISMVGRDTDISAEFARQQIVEISENLLSVLEDLRVVVAPARALELKVVETCDPVRITSRALSPLSRLMKQNSINLSVYMNKPEGVNFSLHAQPFRQVVTNLTKNAAVHSGGSVVHVTFDYQIGKDSNAVGVLIVEDDGRGIAEELREKIFEPFGRGDTESDGSGLGLFIVQQIATMMGGTLECSTSELGGACFTLTFPMKKVEVLDAPRSQLISLEGVRILLAEDDAMLRMLTEKSLGKLGAQITSFDNGHKALAAFEANQFDVVLTDLMMPIMNGHELTKSLRDLGSTIPIIGVTAAVIGDETDDWLKDGADAFISKPITPEKLQDVLDSIGFTLAEAT